MREDSADLGEDAADVREDAADVRRDSEDLSGAFEEPGGDPEDLRVGAGAGVSVIAARAASREAISLRASTIRSSIEATRSWVSDIAPS